MSGTGTWDRWTVVVLVCFAVASSVAYRIIGADGRAWQSAINNDGKGYYEYLRAPLVDGWRVEEHGEDWMFAPAGDGRVIKYFIGTALIQAPFVLLAHGYTLLLAEGPEDGYSLHYHLSIVLSAWISLLLGLHFTRRVLKEFVPDERVVAFTLIAITLGTGLLVQAVMHPGMSHVHSFAAIAASLFLLRRSVRTGAIRDHVAVGALLGIVFLLRPVDLALIAAFPLITRGATSLHGHKHWLPVAAATIAFLCVAFLQSLAWKIQCGDWIVRPYAGEGFHWDRPAVFEHLFSARNGLLFYWPVLVLVPLGTIQLFRTSRLAAVSLILFLLAFGYITSAWWNWSYGDSFGQRPYVDMLPILALPMALAMWKDGQGIQSGLLFIAAICTLHNVFQSWQYATGILDPARMNLEKYAQVVYRTDPGTAASLGGIHDLPPFAPQGMMPVLDTTQAWEPDSAMTMYWLIPECPYGEGSWYLELGVSRTRIYPTSGPDDSLVVDGNSDWWPTNGIPFMLEHVRTSDLGSARWTNCLRIPAQHVGDSINIRHISAGALRIDSVYLRVSAPL